MSKSKIEWCDVTINPIVGCSKISPACDNCYAEGMANRLQAMGTRGYDGVVTDKGDWSGKLNFIESELEKPTKWKTPKRIFVGSMTDIFHKDVDFDWVRQIVEMVEKNPIHTFIFLTKRPEKMKEFFDWYYAKDWKVIENLWLGVTAENKEQAQKRIPTLLEIPASKRFVSIEPMLSEIDLNCLFVGNIEEDATTYIFSSLNGLKSTFSNFTTDNTESHENIKGLDWVIVGGESGHNARITNPKWVLSLQKQCQDTQTPFFFKQWGEFIEQNRMTDKYAQMKGQTYSLMSDGEATFWRCGRKLAGKLLDGKLYQEFPSIMALY